MAELLEGWCGMSRGGARRRQFVTRRQADAAEFVARSLAAMSRAAVEAARAAERQGWGVAGGAAEGAREPYESRSSENHYSYLHSDKVDQGPI